MQNDHGFPHTSLLSSLRRLTIALAVAGVAATPAAIAGTLTNLAPAWLSPGITARVFGTGFNPTLSKNRIRLIPQAGAPVDVTPTAIALADKTNGVYSLTFAVPSQMPLGTAAVTVTNTDTNEVSEGRSLQIIQLQLPEVASAARGAKSVVVAITGTAGANFVSANTRVVFGAGVTVTNVAIESATTLRATIDVAPTATLGARSIAITTPLQTLALLNGFQVTEAGPVNNPPVARHNGPLTGKTGEAVTFDGSASSDPDQGNTLTYAWDFGDGTPTAAGANVQHTYQKPGTFPVTLTVTDNHGASNAATTSATITEAGPVNNPPVARHNGPLSGKTGETISFDGSASSDPDQGNTLTYAWNFGDGTPVVAGAQVQHTYQNAGTFPVTLTVTDNHGASATVTTAATITAAPPPPPDETSPFVTLTAPTQALAGAQVTVTALATDNVSVTRVKFVVNGQDESEDASAPYERVFAIPNDAAAGTVFTIHATAFDAAGNTGAKQTTVVVAATPDTTSPQIALNAPPHASPGGLVTLSAVATDNVGVASVAFFANNELVATVTLQPYQSPFTIPVNAAVGSIVAVRAVVTDLSGRTAEDTADITVVAAPDTTAPSIALSAPEQIGAGRTLLLTATAEDNVGVASVQFFVDDVLIATDTQPPYEASFPVPASSAQGRTLSVRARGVDYSNNGDTDEGSVSVLANRLPTAVAGGPYTVQVGDLVQLTGANSSDPDNDALTYAWLFGDESKGTGPSPSHAYNTAGVFTVTLTVSDGRGGTATVTTSVNVTAVADRAPPAITLNGPSRVLPGIEAIVVADVADNVGVTQVAFTVNDGQPTIVNTAPFNRVVEVPAVAPPGTSLIVRGTAKDAAGNTATSQHTLTITAAPDSTSPTVSMRLPERTAAGATLIVGATAADESGVKLVTFYAGDAVIGNDSVAPYEATFTVPQDAAAGVALAFAARASDFSDNVGQAAGTVPVADAGDNIAPTVNLIAPATIAAGGALPLKADAKDDGGVAAVEFFVDGVRVASDETIPYQIDYPIGAGRVPGALLRLQARAIDFAGHDATASGESRVTAAGLGVIAGEVFDALTGLPLADAVVTLTGKDALGRAYAAKTTSDARGRYLIRANEGAGELLITRAAWTTVIRKVSITTGVAVQPIDARLTPLTASVSVQPVVGGLLAQDGHEVDVPGGALASATALRLTPIGAQALQGLLPAGWSPLAAIDVAPRGVTFGMPAHVRAPQSHAIAAGTEVLLARWDEESLQWRAVAVVPVIGNGQPLAGEISSTGQYAWLLPDALPVSPSIPAAGLEVPGIEIAPLPEASLAIITPQPKVVFYQPGVRSTVSSSVSHSAPLSSGAVLRSRISEEYRFFSGAEARPDPYTADIIFYQTETASDGIGARYPVTPSLPFEALTLQQGVIGVELYVPQVDEETLPLLGPEGGATTIGTGERLEIAPGAVADTTAFRLLGLPVSQLGLTLPTGVTFAGGVTLDFAGQLTSTATISIPRPTDLPAGSRVLFASLEEVAGETRFVLAGVGRIDGERLVSDVVIPGAPTLDGARRSGRYVFLRVNDAVAFFSGVVSGVNNAPQVGALITNNRLAAIVSRSGTSGQYVAAVLTGASTLTARDIVKNDTGSAEGSISAAWSVATLALTLVAERPSVVSVSPGANATAVPLSAPVVVRFSESIDPATLGNNGITLTGASGAVAASVALSGNNTTVTLRPIAALAPNGTYTINISNAIKDLAGYGLVASVTSSFASLDTEAPDTPEAGQIAARIPVNGQTTVTGSGGTVSNRDSVKVVNKTTGATVQALVEANGSFSVNIAAGLKDVLEIRITDLAGNETVVAVGRFSDPDGRVVITDQGGDIDAANGLRLSIAPDTFPDGAIVKFTALEEQVIAPTVPVGDDYPFVAAFEIDASVPPQRYMNVSFPAPAGSTATSTGIVAQVVQVYGQRALSIVDTAKIINGRIATSSPPCEGIVAKFGRYAMFMNEHEQMKFGTALLSMTVPRTRSIVIAPYVITNPFLPYPPTILHPGFQWEEQYNPATPFIRYIEAGGNALLGLAAAQASVCFPVPPDTISRVVVRDGETGAVIQDVAQTTPPVGQNAAITTIHVAPGDITHPTVLSTSWSPRSPHVLDSGKPIQVMFSEAVVAGAPPGEASAYLVNQQTGERLTLGTRISPDGRVVTFLPEGALPIGTDYLLRMPGIKDLAGNVADAMLTFRTYQPTFVLPSVVQGVPSYFTRSHIQGDFAVRGIELFDSRIHSVALNDIDFVTLSPEESPTGRWQTTLFGIGNAREFGFQILSIDASQPRQPHAIGMLWGGQRFYNQMKVLPDFGLNLRQLPAGDSREAALTTWRTRELHYLSNNPSIRICAPTGDPRIAAWRARQGASASFAMKSSCGTLGLVTSHNVNYSILHFYDLSNATAPVLLGQRLLSDGGAVSGFPPRPEAPAANGSARGVDLIEGVDFTHTVGSQSFTRENVTAAFVAVFGSGLTAVDLGYNIPDVDFRDRPPGGNVIESLQHWTLPYYQDLRLVRNHVVAIANDVWDGTGTAHLEVFDAGLQPIGLPLPLPVNPYMMTAAEGLLTFDEDGNGAPEQHDYAFVSGRQGLAMVELRPTGAAQLVGFVPMPNVPRDDRGLEVSRLDGSCPNLTFYVNDIKVRAHAATVYRRGSCANLVGGARVYVVTVPQPDGLRVDEVTFLETPALLLVEGLRHVEIDRDTKLAYIAGSWKKFDQTYEGFVIVDVSIPYGGFTDRDEDGWDDRIRGFVPVTGIGAPFAAGRVNGFRIDPRRKLIYAAIDTEPNDYNEANIAILRTCECAELEAQVTLTSGGAGTGPDRPSTDGTTTTIFVTPEMLESGQFRALFDIDNFTGSDIHFEVTELTMSGNDADRLLDLTTGRTGTLAEGSRSIRLNLRPAGSNPRGSVVAIDFTDAEGNFLKRAILHLVTTNVTADDVKVRTFIDRTNRQIYETPAYLYFLLNHDARVTIKIDGQVISPGGDGQTAGTPFADVPLPAGMNRVLITRPMVSLPGEHQFEIRAVYDEGVETVLLGKAIHDVTIDESLPVGHTFIKGVDLADGHLALSREDLTIPGVGPALTFSRTYSNIGNRSGGAMGAGWSHNWESRLAIDAYGRISIAGGEGSGMRFVQAEGDPTQPNVRMFKPQVGYHGSLVYSQGAYDYYTKARTRYHYELSPSQDGDPEYRLTFIEDSNGNRLTLTYTGLLLTRVTDAAGRSLTFTYELKGSPAEHRVTRLEGPLDLVVSYDYDEFGNLAKAARASRVEQYAYTVTQARDRHNLLRATDPNGRHTDYTYFAANDTFPGEQPNFEWGRDIVLIPMKHELVKHVTEGAETPEAAVTKFAFDFSQLNTRYITTVTDPRDVPTRYTLNARGSVNEVRVLDSAGDNVTTMRWAFEDGLNDVFMTSKTDPNGRVTRYEYDNRGNMTKESIAADLTNHAPVANAAGEVVDEVVTQWEYDTVFNRLIKKTDPEGNVTEYSIDPANGNVVSMKTDPRDGTPAIVTHMAYDAFPTENGLLRGLLKTTTDARGHVTTYREYDTWGNPTKIEDPEGHITTQVFDARGRMTETSDTIGHRVSTVYDELDRVKTTTRFAVHQPSDPAMQSPNQVMTTTYFPGGQKKLVVDGLGHEVEYEYDGLNRPRKQIDRTVDADGTDVTLEISWEYDGNGNRKTEVDRRGITRHYTWDALNRQRKVEVADNGGLKRISEQEYDAAGNITADIDIHGHRTTYALDSLYRRVKVNLPLQPYAITMTYDLAGNELTVSDANGRKTTRTFDGIYRRRTEKDPAGNIVQYAYDAAGNLLTETHTRTGLVRRHGPYDKVNRPLGSSVEFNDPVTNAQVTYTTSTQFLDDEHAVISTNPRGFSIKERFNGFDKPIERVIDPDGLALTTLLRYDANGNEDAIRDAEGEQPDVIRTFDGLGRKLRSQYLLDGEERTYYDGNDNVVRTIDKRGIEMRHEYDALDRKTVDILIETISNGGQPLVTATIAYDDAASKVTTSDANGHPTVVELDGLHHDVRTTDAADQTTVTTWDGLNKRSVTTPRGLRREFDYDAVNRVVAVREFDTDGTQKTAMTTEYRDGEQRQIETDRRGSRRILQFDALGRVRRVSRRHADLAARYGAEEIVTEEFRYDGNNNVIEALDANGHVTRYSFDAAERRESVTEGFGSPVAATTTFTYDRVGNLLTIKDSRNHGGAFDQQNTYDARYRRITQANGQGQVSTFTYDQNDQVATFTEPRGAEFVTGYAYDELGKLLSVDETRGGIGGITRYAYDPNRNKVAQQDASGNLTTYVYDVVDRLTDSYEHFVPGGLTAGSARGSAGGDTSTANHWHYEYDADGNERLLVDADGQQVTKSYDHLNQLVRKDYSAHRPASDGSTIYPQLVSIVSTIDGNGNVTRVDETKRLDVATTVVETTHMTFDPLDRLISRTNPDNKTVAYTYDRHGNRVSVTDADNLQTLYTFDQRNQLRTATVNGSSVTQYEYWPDGLLKTTTYSNGMVTENTYDRADRPASTVSHTGDASAPVSKQEYQYDASGNRRLLTETHRQLTAGTPQQTTYEYDALNRLSSVHYPNGAAIVYTHALNGNRLTETGTDAASSNPVSRTYEYNRVNQLARIIDNADAAASVIYVYDRNGNTREQRIGALNGEGQEIPEPTSVKRFDFDIRDKLAAVRDGATDTFFDYDFTGLRTRKRGLTELRFLYDETAVLQEYAPTGQTLTKYNYGAGLLSMESVAANGRESLFYATDAMDSTTALTDQSGTIRASYLYDAFGGLRQSADTTANRRRFTGHYDDTETGLQYFNARYYDPKIGRFLSEDPYTGNEHDPPSLHRYAYANGNPATYIDPTGYYSESVGETASDLAAWGKHVGNGVIKGLGAPIAGLLEAGFKGLGDIAIAGIGYLAIEAAGYEYVDEIGALLQPMSTIGRAAAEKGTITAIKESATGFVRDTVKGTVTLPSRIIEASASGDPELLGMTMLEAVQAGQGMKAPLQKVTTATVRTTERLLATKQILMRERVSKRGIDGKTREVTGTITVQDAWTLAGLCVQKGATGCAVVGGLRNPSWSNLWKNVKAKGTLARGEMLMNDAGKGYKYQGDVDFIQMRKDAPVMKDARLAAEVNARTSAQLLDQFPEHGVLGEFLPPEIVPMEVKTAWWAQEKLAPGSPIRAYDYWKKGVVLPDHVTLFDGKGKKVSGPFAAAYLAKPGKPGVTRRRLEKDAFEITNVVHVLDDAPKFASRPDMLLRFTLNTGQNQTELEKRQSK